jgi:FkbM family methyltransferase
MSNGEEIVTNVFNEHFSGIKGDYIFESIRGFSYFSPQEIIFLKQFIDIDDNVMEIGTNIGCHTIPLSSNNPNGEYFCFEPQKHIYTHLTKNITMNSRTNVTPFNFGLGEHNKTIYYDKLILHENNSGAFCLTQLDATDEKGDNKFELDIKNINCVESITYLDKLKLIKMDVENMEYEIIVTMKDIITKFNPIIFVEYGPATFQDVCIFLNNLGYKIYWFNTCNYQYDMFKCINDNKPYTCEDKLQLGDINIICFHTSYTNVPTYLEEITDFNFNNHILEDHIVHPAFIFV